MKIFNNLMSEIKYYIIHPISFYSQCVGNESTKWLTHYISNCFSLRFHCSYYCWHLIIPSGLFRYYTFLSLLTTGYCFDMISTTLHDV